MFGFKSIALILAAATAIVSALPTEGSAAGLAKRVADPALIAITNVVRAPEAMPDRTVMARGGSAPTTVPDCISTCQDTLAPIFVQIDAAVDIKASVDVFVTLWLEVVVAIKDLSVNLIALLSLSVDIFADLTIEACADLFVTLIADICAKLQVTVGAIAVVDLSVFLSVFVQICAQIVAVVQAFVQVCVGINAYLDVALVASINILVTLCASVGADATVIASLQALLTL